MKIILTDRFSKSFKKLPVEIRDFYLKQEAIFRESWRDPRLHLKKISGLGLAFSFRLTRNYRVLFYFQNQDTAIFFEIDHRKNIYRF
jgi:mRNA-degrading endonuclease RelE of RelBE toxin-antitoxin system